MRCAKIAMIVCFLAWAAVAAGQGTCSTEMLQGTYAVEHTGLVYMGLTAPYSLLGTIKADQQGNVTSHWVQVNPYATLRYDQSGHWTVTQDCKVTLTHIQNGVVSGTSEGLVVHNGDEIRMMLTAPLTRAVPPPNGPQYPSAGSGILRRMSPGANEIGNCSTRMLRGTYAQTCAGYMVQPTTPMTFMPYRASITLKSNGDGTFGGNGTLVVGGQLFPFEYKEGTATNNVGPNCWGTAQFQLTTRDGTWDEAIVVFDQGKEMLSTTTGPTGQVDICRFTRIDH